MKDRRVMVIAVLFSTAFLFQSLAMAQIDCLRQKAFGERQEKSLVEALQSFGIEVAKNRLDFTDVPDNVDWVMDEARPPAKGPIISTLKEMPVAKLMYSVNDSKRLPPISTQGTSSAGVYIGLVEWQENPRPAVIKLFNESNTLKKREAEIAQVCSYLGTSPRFYGVVKNESGSIVGYAMQLAIGEAIPGPEIDIYYREESNEHFQLVDRLWNVGLTPTGECLITRKNRVLLIDAGGVTILYSDEARDRYEDFVRQMNESAMPRLGQLVSPVNKATMGGI